MRDQNEGNEESLGTAQEAVTNGVINAACADSLTLCSSPGGSVTG